MNAELFREIKLLNTLRDQQTADIQRREDEISKLVMERKLLEEEKLTLKSQVETIT